MGKPVPSHRVALELEIDRRNVSQRHPFPAKRLRQIPPKMKNKKIGMSVMK